MTTCMFQSMVLKIACVYDDGNGDVDPMTSSHGIPESSRRPVVQRVADVGLFVKPFPSPRESKR
jgi:hypothetical protein